MAHQCPHCGQIDWSRAPSLQDTLTFVRGRRETTARQVADRFKVSISNASGRLDKLLRLGTNGI
jgi:hypothetical protein